MLAFDTNLVFYATNHDSPFHLPARAFLDSLQRETRVVVSELMLVELYRLLRNPTINEQPLDAPSAARVIAAYRHHPKWRLVGLPTEGRELHDDLWARAGERGFPYRRIYDIRLALSLQAQGVTDFATVNLKDFQALSFRRVWNPLE